VPKQGVMQGAWGPTDPPRSRRLEGTFRGGRKLVFGSSTRAAVLILAALLVGCSAVVFMVPGSLGAVAHLFYVPILMAAVRFGRRGAAVVAVVAATISGPGIALLNGSGSPQEPLNWAIRGGFFLLLGLAMAWVAARHRGAEEAVDRSRQTISRLNERLRFQEQQMARRREATERVQRMLDEETFAVVVQPIADLRTGRVVGVEALSRFNAAPDRPPDGWFAEAKEVGLALELELKTVRRALELVAKLPRDMYLAVNLSPDTIASPRFGELMDGIPPDRIVLEVTEHAPVEDYEVLAKALDPFRARGCRLAVDDAGAGFASFRHILRLNPDVIKLDMTLTRNIDHDPARRALASGLISFASDLGAKIIAEGIENTSELGALRVLGVGLGQGYYLGRPEPLRFLDFTRVEKTLRPMTLAGGGSAPMPGQKQQAVPSTPGRRTTIPEHRPRTATEDPSPGRGNLEPEASSRTADAAMRARPQAPAQQ
jgi:EAL domain-containing protein (putative c-di-GMP-specific phosphodiesterase class I)